MKETETAGEKLISEVKRYTHSLKIHIIFSALMPKSSGRLKERASIQLVFGRPRFKPYVSSAQCIWMLS